jgi:hypothetical protein
MQTTKKEFIEVDYTELDKAISVFLDRKVSTLEMLELRNDTFKEIEVSKYNYTSEKALDVLKELKADKDYVEIWDTMNLMATLGVIEEGTYLIRVSW